MLEDENTSRVPRRCLRSESTPQGEAGRAGGPAEAVICKLKEPVHLEDMALIYGIDLAALE